MSFVIFGAWRCGLRLSVVALLLISLELYTVSIVPKFFKVCSAVKPVVSCIAVFRAIKESVVSDRRRVRKEVTGVIGIIRYVLNRPEIIVGCGGLKSGRFVCCVGASHFCVKSKK